MDLVLVQAPARRPGRLPAPVKFVGPVTDVTVILRNSFFTIERAECGGAITNTWSKASRPAIMNTFGQSFHWTIEARLLRREVTEGESSRRSRLKVYTEAEQEWYRARNKRHGDGVFLGAQFWVFVFWAALLWLFFVFMSAFGINCKACRVWLVLYLKPANCVPYAITLFSLTASFWPSKWRLFTLKRSLDF